MSDKFDIADCADCGLQWSVPMPTAQELDTFYTSTYDYADRKTLHGLSGFVRERFLHPWRMGKLVRLIRRHAPRGPILDYGFGEGRLLLAMTKAGFDVVGADYSSRLVALRRQQGYNVIQGAEIDALGVAKGSLACLVATHVIEHLTNPIDFLCKGRDLVCDNGLLLAAVPSRTSLRARLNTTNWHIVDPPNHQWSFSPGNFARLLAKAGWRPVYVKNQVLVGELVSVSVRN